MSNAHDVTKQFEAAVCDYTGAPFAVAVTSCTMALFLALKWNIDNAHGMFNDTDGDAYIEIPKRTYVSVPQQIKQAGGYVRYRDEPWSGMYQLSPTPIWDSARLFTSGMYRAGQFQCLSFHVSKTLGDSQGGAILHDNGEADAWFRKARFDGRTEGVAPKDDHFDMIGWHCYMSPDVATRLLWKLASLPKHNQPLPNDEYPDLSQIGVFR